MTSIRRAFAPVRLLLSLVAFAATAAASAHDSAVGDIAIAHPFATPSLAGSTNGAVYFATLANKGEQPDRLVRAKTPVAARVELHTMAVDALGVMRMREVEAIEVAPKASIKMQPGAGLHLMLMELKAPLKEGATFPMTLEFARAGTVEVKVVVQTPRAREGASAAHMH